MLDSLKENDFLLLNEWNVNRKTWSIFDAWSLKEKGIAQSKNNSQIANIILYFVSVLKYHTIFWKQISWWNEKPYVKKKLFPFFRVQAIYSKHAYRRTNAQFFCRKLRYDRLHKDMQIFSKQFIIIMFNTLFYTGINWLALNRSVP